METLGEGQAIAIMQDSMNTIRDPNSPNDFLMNLDLWIVGTQIPKDQMR